MAARRGGAAEQLRSAVDCLPASTKAAMLGALDEERIIVGGYTDGRGGVCPMLGAHRRGGRTSLVSFARSWDRYTGAPRRARSATRRELSTLRAMLEVGITRDELGDAGLAGVRAEVEARRAAEPRRQAAPPRDTGERDRTAELRHRPGWAWLRPFRRYDTYAAALERLETLEHQGAEPVRELEPA